MNQLRRENDDTLHMENDAQSAVDAVLAANVVVALDAVMAANTVHDALRGRDRLPGRPNQQTSYKECNSLPMKLYQPRPHHMLQREEEEPTVGQTPTSSARASCGPCSRQSHRKAR